ncbi:MAG TPA: NUDIX domain-containing protein [Phenylobacterium sp.]
MAAPQFGEREAGREYRDRPAAFGILEQAGKIALVRVEKPGYPAWHDLPGGAIDPGETPEQAVVREYGEETGLKVSVGQVFTAADQYFVNTDGEAFDNLATFFTLRLQGHEPRLKIEDDHTLVWAEPHEALAILRHEAHAWAVTAWLRLRARA